MEETHIDTLEWLAPEYNHKERSVDWLWSIGLVALAGACTAFWFHNYVFAIFIILSGASLILFTIRAPRMITCTISTEGIALGKEKYEWKSIKGFAIKKGDEYNKLLILTSKKFLPTYTIFIPSEKTLLAKESLLKMSTELPLEESHSILFMEKIGF